MHRPREGVPLAVVAGELAQRGDPLVCVCVPDTREGGILRKATPTMQPTASNFRQFSAMTATAAFIEDARRRAVASGRCTRVRLVSNALVTERRTGSDCVNLAAEGWSGTGSQLRLEGAVQLSVESLTQPGGVTAADHHIVFRPNGRLYGDGDLDVTDDGARVVLSEIQAVDRRAVVITPQGRVCPRSYGATLPALAASGALACP